MNHLIHMMSIMEVEHEEDSEEEEHTVRDEWLPIHQDNRSGTLFIHVIIATILNIYSKY